MRLFSGLFGLIVLALALSFALTNRQSTVISLWPFGFEIAAPLYLLTLGTLFLGLILGALIAWANMLPHQLAARRLRKDIARLHVKIEDLQQTVIAPPRAALPKPKGRFWKRRA